ncbi:hypothetical protein GOBAR_AA30975 [Gossypium barbadense]|uniref:Uncharacterized protein n=1 Tax=Gossypium barbadense TaxID=3634 RepID=A0A2P5WF66_GOSBA|nr:hypothetical protein GOBAR_AA30975 [Gossypium barbadense]
MQQMHRAKAIEEMGCDARGEGDGGDGLRCTGRRRWRGWRGHSTTMQQMHRAKAIEEMGCDARGEGDGGDGLRCTGRRRWRGWVAMHRAKATNENI